MMQQKIRGIPILLFSLLLTGVGGGLAFAGGDPAGQLLELRLRSEQAIADLRANGKPELADEMARQLPAVLGEVVDRVSFDLPDPAHFDRPVSAEILATTLEEQTLQERLAALADYAPSAPAKPTDDRREAKEGERLALSLEARSLRSLEHRGASVLAARVRFVDGQILVRSAAVTTPSGITTTPTTVTVTPGAGATVTPGGPPAGSPASPPGQGSDSPGNSGNNGRGK